MYQEIADYLFKKPSFSKEAYETALLCLMDALGCATLALNEKEAVKLIEKKELPWGKEAVAAAFQWGLLIRWLDYNDTWLAKEWGHPSDNIGTFLSREDLNLEKLLEYLIQAYEIQGVLALSLSCNREGFDHVYFVKIASCALAAKIFGATKAQVADAVSQAFIDGASLRVYRHGINTGPRKSWAAGDAAARGVYLAELTMKGEPGYPNSLLAPRWGVQDVLFKGQKVELVRPLDEYVISHILFKVLYPAEFHAQTAIEAAIKLFPLVKGRHEDIQKITITTHESAIRIIDKKGPLKNPADRDHCLQYMVAVALLQGSLDASDYEEPACNNPKIDLLRDKMEVVESTDFSDHYHHEDKRSIANSLQIFFKDGSKTEALTVEYPIGHPKRRQEALPLLRQKFESNLLSIYSKDRVDKIVSFFSNFDQFKKSKVSHLRELFNIA